MRARGQTGSLGGASGYKGPPAGGPRTSAETYADFEVLLRVLFLVVVFRAGLLRAVCFRDAPLLRVLEGPVERVRLVGHDTMFTPNALVTDFVAS